MGVNFLLLKKCQTGGGGAGGGLAKDQTFSGFSFVQPSLSGKLKKTNFFRCILVEPKEEGKTVRHYLSTDCWVSSLIYTFKWEVHGGGGGDL